MNQEKLIQDIASLPPVAQQEPVDFIEFLKLRYGQDLKGSSNKESSIEDETFVGMWKDRSDLNDSSTWVRNIRKKEWE